MVACADHGAVARTPLTSRSPPAVGGRRLVRVQFGALFLLAYLAVLASQPVAAQDRTPSPSAEELWESYPLRPSPSPAADPPAGSSPDAGVDAVRRPTGTGPERSEGGAAIGLLDGLVILAVLSALALVGFRRWREIQSQAAAAPLESTPRNAGVTVSAAAATRGEETRASQARELPAGQAAQADPDASGSTAALPPDTSRAWTAEIGWRHTDTESRFCIIARAADGEPGTVVAKSSPLEWPPVGDTSVRALAAAADWLEAALVDAGWTALPPGSEWYAKRFSWQPVAGALTDPPGAPLPGSGRFGRRPSWPEGSSELWRSEIELDAGQVDSRFRAAVYPPGRAIGASSALSSPGGGKPDPQAPQCRAEVRGLAAALEAAGWERAGRGMDWFSERFVWRHEGAPPDRGGNPTEADHAR